MNKNLILILSITGLLLGCSAPATPSQMPIASPTEVFPTLTSTPLSPTATEKPATPTLTPEPTLRTIGPYFAYFRTVNNINQLVIMDADGGGRKVIKLPQEIDNLDAKFISPNGKWLAFYTGSAGDYTEMPAQGTSNLTLNLMNLETGETQVITPLLSKDYPNNFVEAAKRLNDPYTTAESLYAAFRNGITNAIGWSPDGQYLAFAGQMDGLSSDLYLYDMEKKAIHRLTSGDEELQWVNWSSDGKWILHGSVPWIGEGTEDSVYAVALDGSSIRNLDHGFTTNWLNSHEFFEYHEQNGIGKYQLRLVDVSTGKITEVWRGSFEDYAVDPTKNWVVLVAFTSTIPPEEEKPNFVPGLQLINLKSLKTIQNPDPLADPPNTFLRTEDGKIVALPEPAKADGEMIFTSPDTKFWAVVINQDVRIYTQELTLVKEISILSQNAKLTDVQWSPDSSGLFLVYGTNLYFMNIPDGNINLVETNMIDYYGLTYKWINDQ